MSPITHFLVGWVALERLVETRRDKALICIAGVAPDIDGIGIVVDFATRALGLPETNYYQDFHRMIGHGLPAAVVIAILVGVIANQRQRVGALAFLAFHLHLICDVLGSRGSTAEDIWPVYYFAPLSTATEIRWTHQWPLVGWQNMTITFGLIVVTMAAAARRGYSPVCLLSPRGDAVFVYTVRQWRERLLGLLGRR